MTKESTSEAFFETMYQEAADPWRFATSSYELQRYAATLKALGDQTFQRAFEPGCSIGVLTERLAQICDRVEAMDISETAVMRARERCRHLPNVTITHGSLPDSVQSGTFDVIVFSEIGYYFEITHLAVVCERLVDALLPGGVLLAVHWLGKSPDHVLSGDQVHETIGQTPGLVRTISHRYDGFRLDRWERT